MPCGAAGFSSMNMPAVAAAGSLRQLCVRLADGAMLLNTPCASASPVVASIGRAVCRLSVQPHLTLPCLH
jgi:hypothetical protein